jgi:glutaminyl-tRNA synthetase
VAAEDSGAPSDFIRDIVRKDLESGKHAAVVTRFPPEPNGFLHIGHCKAVLVSFGIAQQFGGTFHLRFDDTNPSTEESAFVSAQEEDLRWLGCEWGEHRYFTSDYFEKLYEFARVLIRKGKAFVCDLSSDEILARRGTLTEPGTPSPFRDRDPDENLDLFARMRAGEFEPGVRVLRARIDMASPVLPMRDPILYRILREPHHRTGDTWAIYPLYDFAHGLSDAIEGITHSLCSMEFVDHRPLYDWLVEEAEAPSRPRQIEFARLNLTYTVMSKRVLRRLVEERFVSGWDDPRLATIRGLRRRGYTPESLRRFIEGVGVARRENTIQLARLEYEIREQLNREAPRRMAVLDPVKVVIENYPEDGAEELEAVNNPEDPGQGTRRVPFSRELWIERGDFLEDPPKKFFRLAPGREVRLRYAYFVTCVGVVKDAAGEVVELRCTYDPATRGGDAPDGRKVRGTLHWVSARHAQPAEVRLYDLLFTKEDPLDLEEGQDFTANLKSDSLEVLPQAWVEPALADAGPGQRFQFERLGYFCVDPDSTPDHLIVNRTVTLRDSWAKVAKRDPGPAGARPGRKP